MYPDAITAWEDTPAPNAHPWSSRPPMGAAVFWGGGRHGHVALSCGDGYIYTTDLPRTDFVGHVPIGYVRAHWGYEPLGWADWLNGYELPVIKPRPPDPAPNPSPDYVKPPLHTKGDEMLVHKTAGSDSWWILTGGRLVNVTNDEAKTFTGERIVISKTTTWDNFAKAFPITP